MSCACILLEALKLFSQLFIAFTSIRHLLNGGMQELSFASHAESL